MSRPQVSAGVPAQKILAIGSPLGNIKELCSKIKQFQKKAGPFDCCVILGDLLALESDASELFDEDVQFVVPTYFHLGSHALPDNITSQGKPEVVKNLIYLGKAGAFTTATGAKIAFIGGHVPHPSETSDEIDLEGTTVTNEELDAMRASPVLPRPNDSLEADSQASLQALRAQLPSHQRGVDLLLLNEAPPDIHQFSNSAKTLSPAERDPPSKTLPVKIIDVINQARPRYMLWSAASENSSPAGGFWEREPFGWKATGRDVEERFTRSIRVAALGDLGAPPGTKTKKKFYYAFSLPSQAAVPPKPDGCTSNPYHQRGLKRSAGGMAGGNEPLPDQNFIFQQNKKAKTDAPTGPIPTGYVCRICNQPGHWIQNCPQKDAKKEYTCKICGSKEHSIYDCPDKGKKNLPDENPPEGYVCKICSSSDHFIRNCPMKGVAPVQHGPPETYICHTCGIAGEHWQRDCPKNANKAASRDHNKSVTELGAEECWFCLSNPNLEKRLISYIGEECYVAMAKGQLIPTQGQHPTSVVPGGGHVLILPIAHMQNPLALPTEEALPLLNEIEQVKSAIRETYKSFGAVPVFFDLTRYSKRGGHYHIQSIPVPTAKANDIEKAFKDIGAAGGVEWEKNPDAIMKNIGSRQYFRAELPDGKKLVHLLRGGSFNMQFGRTVLAQILDLGSRLNWQACPETPEKQYQDAAAFKKSLVAHIQ